MSLQLMKSYSRMVDFDPQSFPVDLETEAIKTIRDPDPNSNYEFSLVRVYIHPHGGNHMVSLRFRPEGESSPSLYAPDVEIDKVSTYFNNWQKVVNESNEFIQKYVVRDAILEEYVNEEFVQFEILEEKVSKDKSYPLPVQLFIDAYLKDVVKRLEAYKEGNQLDEQAVQAVNDVIEEANDLRKNQTKQSEFKVASSLSKMWAKARKAGLEVYTEIKKDALKEIVKYFVKELLSDLGSIFNNLAGLLD